MRQPLVPFIEKGVWLSTDLRADLAVTGTVIVDLKAKEQLTTIDKLKLRPDLRD